MLEGRFAEECVYVGPPTMPPTANHARPAGMSFRRRTVESPGRGILYKNNVGQCAQNRKGKDIQMTKTPAFYSTPLTPGMLIESTLPAPTHLPHNSTFCFQSC